MKTTIRLFAFCSILVCTTLAACDNGKDKPKKIYPPVEVETLLGSYMGTGLPVLLQDGPPTWNGTVVDGYEFIEEKGGDPNNFAFPFAVFTNPFGEAELNGVAQADDFLPIAVVDGKLYLDDYHPVYDGPIPPIQNVLIFACAMYADASDANPVEPDDPLKWFVIGSISEDGQTISENAIELSWDPETRTILFPSTYKGRPVLFGLCAFQYDGYGIGRMLGAMTDFYRSPILGLK